MRAFSYPQARRISPQRDFFVGEGMRNEEIEKEWIRIWTHSSNVDDAVDLIIRNRALPEDVDYARKELETYVKEASEFLDRFGECDRKPCERLCSCPES